MGRLIGLRDLATRIAKPLRVAACVRWGINHFQSGAPGLARAALQIMETTKSNAMLVAAGFVVVLNLLDAMFTVAYTHAGVATEANPLMERFLAASPVLFMIAKLALVSMGVLVLWRLRHHRSARFGLVATGAVYVLLLGYHLSAAKHLVG